MEGLAGRIAREVRERGPLRFDRFMARALYEPEVGYYSRPGPRAGRRGDFVTAPTLTPAYGRALGRLLPLVAAATGERRLRLVDAGAGEGDLVVAACARLAVESPALAIEPVVLEHGEAARAEAARRLTALGLAPRALARPEELRALPPCAGLVVANELVDALPVRRLRGAPAGAEEAWVGLVAGRLEEIWRPAALPPGLPAPLPRGREVSLPVGLGRLVADLAAPLSRGLVLVVDYGLPAALLHAPGGPGNPVRGFRRGTIAPDLVSAPGEVDLTAHVDWSAVAQAARAAALEPLWFTPLTYLLLATGFLEDPDAAAARRLVHPEDMGGAFQCLALGLDLPRGALALPVRDRRALLERAPAAPGPEGAAGDEGDEGEEEEDADGGAPG